MNGEPMASSPVTVRVPAKVNVELRVGGVRNDGYHPLATIYQAVSIYDEVTVTPSDEWSVSVTGPQRDLVPTDGANLALRAAKSLGRSFGHEGPVAINIAKDIPVAGGMAGGSADAAATLVACDILWGLGLPRVSLEEHAALLGSDVGFLIEGGTAIGSGRGELLAPVLTRGTLHWVLALSDDGMSTPQVYAEFDRLCEGEEIPDPQPNPELVAALRAGNASQVADCLTNDLQEAALSMRPDLADVLAAGLEMGALGGIVSGSGPTVAFLTADMSTSIDLAISLTASGAVADVRRATGPVHGAHEIYGMRR